MPKRLAFALATLALLPSDGHAQFARGDGRPAFLSPFFSLFEQPRRSYPEITVRPPPAARRASAPVMRPDVDGGEEPQDNAELGPRAFCVRLCDGYFFPIGPANYGASARAQAMTCNNMCPASPVALYSLRAGGEVEDAIGPQGRRYSALPTAFRFRASLQPGCSCSGDGKGGLATVPLMQDFTLRRGDIVVTEDGATIFAGGGSLPFRETQFVPAGRAQLGSDLMKRLFALRRPSAPPAAEPAAKPNTSQEAELPAVDANRPVRVLPLEGYAQAQRQ